MLSFKKWKSLNESYNFASTGNSETYASFEELLEAKKKAMKKKMDFGGKPVPDEDMDDEEMSDDEDMDDEDEDMDVDDEDKNIEKDAETGDGEVVDATSPKDEEDDDENMNKSAVLMQMKKKLKSKMKKKMAAESANAEVQNGNFGNPVNAVDKESNFWKSLNGMMTVNYDNHFDGISVGKSVSEDYLMPLIDPNTGLVINKEEPVLES